MLFFKKHENNDEKLFALKTYSPMSWRARIVYFLLVILGLFTTIRYALWWFEPMHIPSNWLHIDGGMFHVFDFVIFSFLSFVVFYGLFLKVGTWFTIWFMKRPVFVPPQDNLRVAFLTCFVPGKEPLSMLEKTLISMRDGDYSHDTWVLDEGNSNEVKALCQRLGVFHFSRKDIPHYNEELGFYRKKTKAGNLNAWRHAYENSYDIVAQVDMDHMPKKEYLIRQLGYFTDPKVGYVVIPQVYQNTKNWIARGAGEQTHFYYGPMQQGLYGSHMPFLIGTTHMYRVNAMKEFGGYAPTIAEDYLTSMHFSSHKWKGVYVPEVLAEGEGPTTWRDYFNQQMRWSYGLYEILFKHTHRHFFKLSLTQKINLFFSQLFYFSGLTTVFGFVLTSLYLVFGINATNIDVLHWLFYALPAYISGMLIIFFLHRYYIRPKKEPFIGLSGMFLGQAANIVYVVALWRFLTKKDLRYQVTTKGKIAQTTPWGMFLPHIWILVISIVTLAVSFVFVHTSLVMRFWAGLIVFLFAGLLVSAFFENRQIAIENAKESSPTTALDYDKYDYIVKHPIKIRLLYIFGILAWTSTLYGFSLFLRLNPWYLFFFGPVLGMISIHNYLNYAINIFYKKFDTKKHEALRDTYWQNTSIHPSVDIFLPVCGEKLPILKNTFSSVAQVNYQNKAVYVLDDKGQDEVKILAESFGFTYLSRPNKGAMKKAGNLLYGFQHGRGAFYAVFDADFCPHPDFITELLPYMGDPQVGLVQSPHYFAISGDVHKRSAIEYGSANLQEQFFRTIQVARDRFGGAICAGSNTIYRREALEKNGGPTQVDHGEDVNTGIDIISLGYKIKYIPIILAKGLSPDTLQAFYKQQNRWASSSTGLLLSGKIFTAKLTIWQKLCYLSGITYYMSQLAYFLLPLQLFLVLGFHEETVNLWHSLPFIPYMFYSLILLPLFSRKSKPKLGTYLAVMSSVYVHCYTIILRFMGKPAKWVPTNALESGLEYGFMLLNEFSLFFLGCYFFAVAFLIYEWHLPIFNGLYITLVFWVVWSIIMHGTYFYNSYVTIYKQKAEDVLTEVTHPKQFHFWRLRTFGTMFGILLIFGAVVFYTARITNNKALFFTRSQLLAQSNASKTVALATPQKPHVLGIATASASFGDYVEIAKSGDSLTKLVDKMITVYEVTSGDLVTLKRRRYMEVILVATLSQKPLRPGDKIEISQTEMQTAARQSRLYN